MKSIFDRIIDLCAGSGLSVADLERKCDLSSGAVNKWKTSSPSVEKLGRVADYFNVSIDYLYGRTESNGIVPIESDDQELQKICRARSAMPKDERKRMDDIIKAGFSKYFD